MKKLLIALLVAVGGVASYLAYVLKIRFMLTAYADIPMRNN